MKTKRSCSFRVDLLLLLLLLGLASVWVLALPRSLQAQVAKPEDRSTVGPIAGPTVGPVVGRSGGIAAIVGQEVITYAQLDRRVEQYIAPQIKRRSVSPGVIEGARPHLRRQIIDNMIEQSLLLQEARRLKVQMTEEQLDEEINNRIRRLREQGENIRDSEEFYRLLLENESVTREEYRHEIRNEMMATAVLWYRAWPPREFIGPRELREFYRANLHEFQTPSELTFRMILVRRGDPVQTVQILDAIDKGIEDGVDFADLAHKFSDSKADQGGLWVKKYDQFEGWLPPLPDHLRQMKVGEIRKRILTQKGWCYLKMERIEVGQARSFEEAQSEIRTFILRRRREQDRRAYVQTLRERSIVQIFLPEPPGTGKTLLEKVVEADKPDLPRPPEVKDVSEEAAKPKPKKSPEKKPDNE